ncbi:hypothetical protein AVEN_61163-1 [Araneus ventricosus]|uniref:Uncharacterized protein n=1 Tax=Araneus ventricosus TaxID=182803 RepID=A0A4Y2UX25_ARAVE|nr:hypothetical protein AVEN_61163-1 [Araneus ventricosus]
MGSWKLPDPLDEKFKSMIKKWQLLVLNQDDGSDFAKVLSISSHKFITFFITNLFHRHVVINRVERPPDYNDVRYSLRNGSEVCRIPDEKFKSMIKKMAALSSLNSR